MTGNGCGALRNALERAYLLARGCIIQQHVALVRADGEIRALEQQHQHCGSEGAWRRGCRPSRGAERTRWVHDTDVTQSLAGRSTRRVTLDVAALHRYTDDASPTASTFSDDQSTKFR